MYHNIAIIGGSGGIGSAFTQRVATSYPTAEIHVFSRHLIEKGHPNVYSHLIDYLSEDSIAEAAHVASLNRPLELVFVATGLLHDDTLAPEKSLKELSADNLSKILAVNTILPALLAKHFLPCLNKNERSVFAAISARVGSISDNHLGGWYSYRASKAALNMIIKSAAIETARSNKKAVVIGIHPGTVDSNLSKPFQANVPQGKLFSPQHSVECMLSVLNSVTPQQSGRCFAWDGEEIQP
jgi:NAD(P)-dependent dehydrogenase (short-subunit alcohol dehydrogenase family)